MLQTCASGEWDIVKLNKEIPVLYEENLLWYDIKAHKIYIGLYSITNDAVKTNTTDSKLVYDVMVLDLAATDWTKIGDLSSYLKLNNAQMKPVAMSPWGLLVCVDTKFSLIDYRNNQVLSLEAKADNDYQSLQRNINQGNCYFKDSTLYYGNNEARTLDSISLHYSDFKPTGEVVYTIAVTTVASSYLPWMIGGLLVLVSAAIFYLLKYKVSIQVRKKGTINEVKQEILPNEESSNEINTPSTSIYFDEKELQVLQLLFDNSINQLRTSTDALNNVLGVSKKANDVQKKQRSDVMSSINKKFSFISQNEHAIIDKTRTDVDKRSFEYFISTERLEEVKAVITTT